MAYVSRFDATHEYLEQMKQGSERLQNMKPPHIRRSQLLNLTKTQDRIDLATIAARIAIDRLCRYSRNRNSGLIPRLRARNEQSGGEAEAMSSEGDFLEREKPANRTLRDRLCSDCRPIFDSYQLG